MDIDRMDIEIQHNNTEESVLLLYKKVAIYLLKTPSVILQYLIHNLDESLWAKLFN